MHVKPQKIKIITGKSIILFPYEDTIFIKNYSSFINAVDANDNSAVMKYRNNLKGYLKLTDYEYLVWEEWKEGFARLIENKIRKRYNLIVNQYGKGIPYNRISFYYGGDKFIAFLIKKYPVLYTNMETCLIKCLILQINNEKSIKKKRL